MAKRPYQMPNMAHPTDTAADVINRAMNFSRFGAMSQLFIMDALDKHGVQVEWRGVGARRETNDKVVARLLKADALAGTSRVEDAVRAQAEGMKASTLEEVRKAFDESGASRMVNPAAWYGVGVEIADKLAAVTPAKQAA